MRRKIRLVQGWRRWQQAFIYSLSFRIRVLILFKRRVLFLPDSFYLSLSFACSKESNQRKEPLAAIAPLRKEASAHGKSLLITGFSFFRWVVVLFGDTAGAVFISKCFSFAWMIS